MPIPKFRKVEHTDDGCTLYECLNCYYTWECRDYYRYNYCPWCGIKIEKLECRDKHTPVWIWKLSRGDYTDDRLYKLWYKSNEVKNNKIWVIMCQTANWSRDYASDDFTLDKITEPYVYTRQRGNENISLKDVVNKLKYLRAKELDDDRMAHFKQTHKYWAELQVNTENGLGYYASGYMYPNRNLKDKTLLEVWSG